ncbi:MAG TPA: cyclase family protein [Rhizobiaceae bacterium]|nr:cyclase family protein [Rhizobiaceae bacterium]
MCDRCLMENIRERMLSRRDFFRASAVAGAAALAATAVPAPQALAQGVAKVVDMTHSYGPDFPTFFGQPQIAMKQLFNWNDHKFNLFELTVNEHTGTHMDAPFHFSADGLTVDQIPVENLVVPLAVIDIRAKAAESADAQVTPDDIKAWIAANGDLPENCCVAMNSGWATHVATEKFRNADGEGKMHFPGFHVEAAQMLMGEAKVAGIAVDTLSLDFGMSPDFATHYAWLPSGRWGIECIASLDNVPAAGATFVVGAPKHKGGSGGPARVFAMA